MFRILIPTANRPQFLGTTLRSIQDQTELNNIELIVVSENGGCQESENVCKEFPNLPILYKQTKNRLNPTDHFATLALETSSARYTALIHDDDWWMPNHLENAKKAFEQHPNGAAYFSSYYVIEGESSLFHCEINESLWFGANFPSPFQRIWELDSLNMTLACLAKTPCHYSSMVAKTSALSGCQVEAFRNNHFDSDRMLPLILVKYGTILYQPIPDLFVRHHPGQDNARYNYKKANALMSKTDDWIFKNWEGDPSTLAKNLASRWIQCPDFARAKIKNILQSSHCRNYMRDLARSAPEIKEFVDWRSLLIRRIGVIILGIMQK